MTTGFTYNGAGDRVAKTVNGVTTDYVLDPAAGLTQVLVESTGEESTSYLYGHDGSTALTTGLLAQYDSGRWAYHVNDGLGSVRQGVVLRAFDKGTIYALWHTRYFTEIPHQPEVPKPEEIPSLSLRSGQAARSTA